jgi:hypothetical protein
VSEQSPASHDPQLRQVEQARLARFCQTIHKHSRALDLAIEDSFGGELAPGEWRRAFESSEPHEVNRTMVVTGDYSAVLNAYVEVLKASAGARLIGLLAHRRPHAEQAFKAVNADGGLTDVQMTLLNDLYVLEGRLEHASPDVDAEEVRKAVERLRQALPELIENTRDWLGRHGIELNAAGSV